MTPADSSPSFNRISSLTIDFDLTARRTPRSVGLGGANLNDDVAKIQQLLNLIAPADGGAVPPLVEDGFIGKLTIAAIKRFQQQHKTASDSRVDPRGPTLKKMNELPKPALAAAEGDWTDF